jgi:hypothetical protein
MLSSGVTNYHLHHDMVINGQIDINDVSNAQNANFGIFVQHYASAFRARGSAFTRLGDCVTMHDVCGRHY